jgi:hypothetical protein
LAKARAPAVGQPLLENLDLIRRAGFAGLEMARPELALCGKLVSRQCHETWL